MSNKSIKTPPSYFAKLSCRIPKEVREYSWSIRKVSDIYRSFFLGYLDYRNSKWILRIYSVKWTKKTKGIKIYECCRVVEGYEYSVARSLSLSMSGYTCYYEEDSEFESWNYSPTAYRICNLKSLFEDETFKYCKIEDFEETGIFVMRFIEYFKKEPRIEQLFKMDMHRYIGQYRSVNFDGKNFLQKIGVPLEYYNQNNYMGVTLGMMKKAYKKRMSCSEYMQYLDASKSIRKYRIKVRDIFVKKIMNYDTDLRVKYIDYYNLYGECEMKETSSYWLEPSIKNIEKLHDKLVDKLIARNIVIENERFKTEKEDRAREQQKHNKGFARVFKKFSKRGELFFENIRYIVPMNPCDLINEGEKLRHCVGSMSYIEKHANSRSLILFARLANEQDISLETLEIDLKEKRIIQCRGESNRDSQYHEQIMKGAKEVLALL